jgi:hypothetical protein
MKAKLTLSIDKKLLEEAKLEAGRRHTSLSGLIENYLEFLVTPYVYCFKCGERLDSRRAKQCPKCEYLVCSKCQTCKCSLSEESAVVANQMRRVYEELRGGRLK